MEASLPRFFPSASAAQLAALMVMYGPDAYFGGDARRALYALTTDGYYACPTQRVINASAAASAAASTVASAAAASTVTSASAAASAAASAYSYVFNGTVSDTAAALGLPDAFLPKALSIYVTPWLGSFHGANEDLFWQGSTPHLTRSERALGGRMRAHWASFITSGAPASREWRPWTAARAPQRRGAIDAASDTASDAAYGAANPHAYLLLDESGDRAGSGWHQRRCALLNGELRFIWNPPTGPPTRTRTTARILGSTGTAPI